MVAVETTVIGDCINGRIDPTKGEPSLERTTLTPYVGNFLANFSSLSLGNTFLPLI